jgi:hypothetical protein
VAEEKSAGAVGRCEGGGGAGRGGIVHSHHGVATAGARQEA